MRQSPVGDTKGFYFGAEGVWGGGVEGKGLLLYHALLTVSLYQVYSRTCAFNTAHIVNQATKQATKQINQKESRIS